MKTIKDEIISKYGTINKFVDEHYTKIDMSRTHMYKLLNGATSNPTIGSIVKLARLLNKPEEEVFNEYSARYRDRESASKHTD